MKLGEYLSNLDMIEEENGQNAELVDFNESQLFPTEPDMITEEDVQTNCQNVKALDILRKCDLDHDPVRILTWAPRH